MITLISIEIIFLDIYYTCDWNYFDILCMWLCNVSFLIDLEEEYNINKWIIANILGKAVMLFKNCYILIKRSLLG